AMIAGLAPGRLACTVITGKSMSGSGDTGSKPKLTPPSSRIARLISMVATGRAMKGAERFIGQKPFEAEGWRLDEESRGTGNELILPHPASSASMKQS